MSLERDEFNSKAKVVRTSARVSRRSKESHTFGYLNENAESGDFYRRYL